MSSQTQIIDRIKTLKKKRNAVILAHNYQVPEVQDIADYVGDSFGLSQKAAETSADVIVFCGVKFMAESAKILSPDKIVLLPEKLAGCPMANMADVQGLRKMKEKYPDAEVVTYANSTAAVKAESDVCCTSSNAVDIVNALDNEQILFVPDKNLGKYVAERTDKEVIIWEGYCATHHRVKPEEVKKVKEKHPDAPILIHPECMPEVSKQADYVGSTAGILRYAKESDTETIIVGTEQGIIHRLKNENPDKKFYLLSSQLICPNMKKTNLDKVVDSLENMQTQIEINDKIRVKAHQALQRMLKLGN
ncbi:MAG: quinolinate synthase NadA [Halothermotrichaceae bacterium]